MSTFLNKKGKPVLLAMVNTIQAGKAYLGEVDGLIGDGDHGMNMNKGFTLFGNSIAERDISFTDGLNELGMLLFSEIGGSMGPIYGTVFTAMAEAAEDRDEIDLATFAAMMERAVSELGDVVEARVGDKTLMDTLIPAAESITKAAHNGTSLTNALDEMKAAARVGRDNTKDLVARFGRSSRLGERSRGVLDAGAVSCCMLLEAMADGMRSEME